MAESVENRTRVVGGWIYAQYWTINEPFAQGVNHVFVPDPPQKPSMIQKTPEMREIVAKVLFKLENPSDRWDRLDASSKESYREDSDVFFERLAKACGG